MFALVPVTGKLHQVNERADDGRFGPAQGNITCMRGGFERNQCGGLYKQRQRTRPEFCSEFMKVIGNVARE